MRGVVTVICSPFSRAIGAAGLAEGPAPMLGGAWAPESCRSGYLCALGRTVQKFPDMVLAPTKDSLSFRPHGSLNPLRASENSLVGVGAGVTMG